MQHGCFGRETCVLYQWFGGRDSVGVSSLCMLSRRKNSVALIFRRKTFFYIPYSYRSDNPHHLHSVPLYISQQTNRPIMASSPPSPRAPVFLITGQTGSGKSHFINSLVAATSRTNGSSAGHELQRFGIIRHRHAKSAMLDTTPPLPGPRVVFFSEVFYRFSFFNEITPSISTLSLAHLHTPHLLRIYVPTLSLSWNCI